MFLIKLLLKLLVLPIIAAVTLIQWVGIFLTQFSTVIFNLLAGLIFLIAVADLCSVSAQEQKRSRCWRLAL